MKTDNLKTQGVPQRVSYRKSLTVSNKNGDIERGKSEGAKKEME